MQQPLITVQSDDSVYFVREVMRKHQIGRVPVVNKAGKVVGLVTAVAICNGFSDKLEEVGSHLQAIIDSIGVATLVFNRFCRLVYWNQMAKLIYKDKIKLHVRCEELFESKVLKEILETGKTIKNIYEVNQDRHLVKNASPIIKQGKAIGVVCTIEDVTKVVNLMHKAEVINEKEELIERPGSGKGSLRTCPKPPCFEAFESRNPNANKLVKLAKKVAKVDVTVLIRGETGTGKELMARSLHLASSRKNNPFVIVDCSAVPEKLFETELFGYEAGAFTGASKKGKKGKLELADKGTLFLDEIGELPLEMQCKLLRVIQEKEFYRVGGLKPIKVDVRFLAATNRDLEEMVKEGTFREDLFYRLNVITLELPSLRERSEDLADLIFEFFNHFSDIYKIPISIIEKGVISSLANYDWPGNYRELRNVTERLVLLSENGCIKMEHVPDVIKNLTRGEKSERKNKSVYCLEEYIEQKEREEIIKALERHANNKAQAARALKIPRSTLYYKMKALNINI
ncbi:MAG: sigma 54-interacting transcriptional regulator [Bacillota bacterium]|nr:sigma 54-interacting transcriptional regulator [Bacillota bacterium]